MAAVTGGGEASGFGMLLHHYGYGITGQAGLANMASGLLGGAVGFHALSASLLGYRMGANSRLIGLASAALCLAALLFGTRGACEEPR